MNARRAEKIVRQFQSSGHYRRALTLRPSPAEINVLLLMEKEGRLNWTAADWRDNLSLGGRHIAEIIAAPHLARPPHAV